MLSILAQRLHTLRMGRKMTLGQLATALNQRATDNDKPNSEAQIGRWERGNRLPAYPELIKLAQFFNVSIDYLVGRTDADDQDIADSFISSKNLRFEGHLLNQSDRSQIYQFIKGYVHGRDLSEFDITNPEQEVLSIQDDGSIEPKATTEEITLFTEDHDEK